MTEPTADGMIPLRPDLLPHLADLLEREWCWTTLGNQMMLVSVSGGCRVAITPGGGMKPAICSVAEGTERYNTVAKLRPIAPDHPMALLLAAVPDLVRLARKVAAAQHNAGDATDALKRAGLV